MEHKLHQALFNEIKGSLFEYLVASHLARLTGLEAQFLRSLPGHYQRVLEQQDHMTREMYPELLPYLPQWAQQAGGALHRQLAGTPISALKLTGQLVHAGAGEGHGEADLLATGPGGSVPISLKLNKRAGAVNTKSGGIKSFFTTYFPGAATEAWQASFNQLVDSEFALLRHELYELAELTDDGHWENWRRQGLPELPGELALDMRQRLHIFYARLALALGQVLRDIEREAPTVFSEGLVRLCGFGVEGLVQLVCFHDVQGPTPAQVDVRVHQERELRERLAQRRWRDTPGTASCELDVAGWVLQIRVKPMNKFTTTAIKMNCSLRF